MSLLYRAAKWHPQLGRHSDKAETTQAKKWHSLEFLSLGPTGHSGQSPGHSSCSQGSPDPARSTQGSKGAYHRSQKIPGLALPLRAQLGPRPLPNWDPLGELEKRALQT